MNQPAQQWFISEPRLIYGTWQGFERDIARLFLMNGFDDIRIVAGSGDRGGDVLGVRDGGTWIAQCKYTTVSQPPRAAIGEVVEASRYYEASRLVVATSRLPGDAFREERARYQRLGVKVEVWNPPTLLHLIRDTPEYPPARRTLRDYQEDAATKFRRSLLDTGRAQIVMATGLGKTVVMAEVVADLLRDGHVQGNRVLVLAHTHELVDQLHRAFWYQLPKWIPTNQLTGVEHPLLWDGVTFATVQSVASRTEGLPRFGLVLVDEAHHVGADVFRRTIDALGAPMLGGVTATPWRGDGFEIDRILGPARVQIGIAEGLRRGFLTEVDYQLLADNIDWSFVQTASRHRYSLSELNRRLILPTRDEEAARIIREVFDGEHRRGGIVFSPTIVHAEAFAAMLRRFDLRAEAISSDTAPRERDKLMTRFRAGQLDLVVTVDLFNEGVDVPDVDLIAFMRVTHSRRIFVQQLGRGLRLSPFKDRVIVLDFVTDLRRVAEVVELDAAVRGADVERLGLGGRLVRFADVSAGTFLREWILDQADLALREGDPTLELPDLEFPVPRPPGAVQ